jgi:hypothetical protein
MNDEFDLRHLAPEVAEIAMLDGPARIAYIRKDRFIKHSRAKSLLEEFAMLMALEDAVRPQGRLLVGYPLMGKSTVIDQFMKLHPADDNPSGDAAIVPIVRVQYPESAKDGVYAEILAALNSKLPNRTAFRDIRIACVDMLRRVGMRILIIDEFHNILEGSAQAQRKALNSVKYLMNELRRPIVVAGTEDVFAAVQRDPQISSRLPPLPLKRFSDDDDFMDLLAGFELLLPLRRPSGLYGPELSSVIYKQTMGITGEVADVLNEAAILAIQSGTEQITAEEITALKQRPRKVDQRIIKELLG